MTPSELEETARTLLKDPDCGSIFRIKGFVPDGDGWFEINASHDGIRTKPLGQGQNVVILVGENMKKDRIDPYFS